MTQNNKRPAPVNSGFRLRVALELPPDLVAGLHGISERTGEPFVDICRKALRSYLETAKQTA